jgi:hypothetical protein
MTCGNLFVDSKCYDPYSASSKYVLAFEVDQAKAGPNFSHCEASYLAGFNSVPLIRAPAQDGQCPLKYVWDLSVGRYPVTVCVELHNLADVSEEFVRLFCDSSARNPASKSSLLNDVNTTGDLQLVCMVSSESTSSRWRSERMAGNLPIVTSSCSRY